VNRLIYIHGFNSSPESYKATTFRQWLSSQYPDLDVAVPYLKPFPADSIRQLSEMVESCLAQGDQVGLVGSSLGGYYATWLSEKYGCKAVLVNPAVRPYELLSAYIGENKNFYNNDHYLFEKKHVEELQQLDIDIISRPSDYLVLLQTGDETLDYRQAASKFYSSPMGIVHGGDHGFQDFESWFSVIMRFLEFQEPKT
jgi:predicted esterase YcpF (UPF0227 family)